MPRFVMTFGYVGDFPSQSEVDDVNQFAGCRVLKTNPFGAMLVEVDEDRADAFLSRFNSNWKIKRVNERGELE